MGRHLTVVSLLPLSTVGPPTTQVLICSVPYACTALTQLLACTPWETNLQRLHTVTFMLVLPFPVKILLPSPRVSPLPQTPPKSSPVLSAPCQVHTASPTAQRGLGSGLGEGQWEGWVGPYTAQRRGCFARLSYAVSGWLRAKPPQAGQCPSPSRGLWAALARATGRPSVLAPPPAPGKRLAKATLTGACPRGWGRMSGPGSPAPIFQLLRKPCQDSRFTAQPAGSVRKTPKGPTQHFVGALTPANSFHTQHVRPDPHPEAGAFQSSLLS